MISQPAGNFGTREPLSSYLLYRMNFKVFVKNGFSFISLGYKVLLQGYPVR